jgi:hypothetical protein
MKKIITIALFLLPLFGFSQTVLSDTSKVKVVVTKTQTSEEDELSDEYKERPFQGKEEKVIITPFTGLTDHEIYNLKLKMAAKKEKALKKSK